jgi:hypothetical protein
VSLPGPPVGIWALGLIFWAVAAGVLGEAVRLGAAPYVAAWRTGEPIQRGLLDFYLGGAVLYLVAALPFGWFIAPVVDLLPVAGASGIVGYVLLRRRTGATWSFPEGLRTLVRPSYLTVLGSAAALYAIELAVATPVGTGNTFDSGVLATYTGLLLRHHTIPLSLQPYSGTAVLYPQGTTVWLGWAQLVFSLPPARTSLLVTPLFLALAPLGGFVFGRRMFASERAGVAVALALAWLAPATRGMVAGSNDFVFAFPLVLFLAGEATAWLRTTPPPLADALGFGLLAGYSAAMNPVGAEWLLPAIIVAGIVARPAFGGRVRRWFLGWGTAVMAALVGVVPSLYVLIQGRNSPSFVTGAAAPPPGYPTGISTPEFLGSIDPFLFRSQDVQLSQVPALRLELALLLVLGLALLIVAGRTSALARYLEPFRRFALGAGVSLFALLAVVWSASTGFAPAAAFGSVTSAGEVSTWLFTLYVMIASLLLVLALERVRWTISDPATAKGPSRARVQHPRYGPAPNGAARTLVPLAVALVVVMPGIALTPTALTPVLSRLYQDFGNVTADDFALLQYAGAHLPAGARVLIAPGSAADFLPGYAADLVLLYPLIPGWEWVNASYTLVVNELSNATLDARGLGALTSLHVGFVIVTGNSTVLWPAFSPLPLLANPAAFEEMWHQGDAYLFAWTGP